jgi:hypothetical protein
MPSLAGPKGLSGCAVRPNSKRYPVEGPIVLKLEGRQTALLMLGSDGSSDGDPDFSSDNGDSSDEQAGVLV